MSRGREKPGPGVAASGRKAPGPGERWGLGRRLPATPAVVASTGHTPVHWPPRPHHPQLPGPAILLFFLSHLRLTWPLTFFLCHPCYPSQAFALTFWNPESLLSPLIHPPGLELHLSFQNLFLLSGVLGFPLLPLLTRLQNSTASLEQRPAGNHNHAWSMEPAQGAEVGGPQLCALWVQGKAGSRRVLGATPDITAMGKLILGS